MKWSWRICRVAGIDIFLHATFPLLVLFVAWMFYQRGGWRFALIGVALIVAVFTCVVLHELGHALTARHFGIRTRDITLLPIGGVARLERMPDDPTQELLVAIAGPAVNVVIAALLFPLLVILGQLQTSFALGARVVDFIANVFLVNVLMVLFNLLPAFPMDGGRMLRALLAYRMDYLRATRIAASVGQVMAMFFFVFGLYLGLPLLMLVALFVFLGAAQEAAGTAMHTALNGIPVRQAMLTDFVTLSSDATLGEAAAFLLEGSQQDFPVVDDGRVVGVLLRRDLMSGLSQQGPAGSVGEIMQTEFGTVDDRATLEAAFQHLQSRQCPAVPVVRDGVLVGMITLDNIGEFVMVQSALRKLRGNGSPAH